jgi:hypothetical protein
MKMTRFSEERMVKFLRAGNPAAANAQRLR